MLVSKALACSCKLHPLSHTPRNFADCRYGEWNPRVHVKVVDQENIVHGQLYGAQDYGQGIVTTPVVEAPQVVPLGFVAARHVYVYFCLV